MMANFFRFVAVFFFCLAICLPASADDQGEVLSKPGPIVSSNKPVTANTQLSPGMQVQANWNQQWWAAKVLAVYANGTVKIHYVGWESSWDEVVPRSRLQLADPFGDEAVPARPAIRVVESVVTFPARPWGPEQVTGAPNTLEAGDRPTAWAPATSDGQTEWLLLQYAEPVEAIAAVIYETYKPGAVSAVSVFDGQDRERVVWTQSPQAVGQSKRILVVPLGDPTTTQKIKVTVDSAAVAGWNEIDAVGLVDSAGQVHWALMATASSSYGLAPQKVDRAQALEQEVARLRSEVAQLKRQIQELEKVNRALILRNPQTPEEAHEEAQK